MSHYDQKEKRTLAVYILIFVLLAAGIAIGGILSYRNFEEQFLAQAESQLSAIAELKVNDLVNWRKERLADAEILHQSAVFATLAQSYFENPQDASAQAQLQDWLDSYQVYPDYDRVRLLDAQGQTRLSSPVDLPPISPVVAQRIPEILQSKQVTLVDFYRSETDQSIALGILIPILDSQTGDQVIGLVALSIDPQIYLYPFIQRWPSESASAETLLIRREEKDALYLNSLRFEPDAALNLRSSLDETQLPAVKAALGQTGIVEGLDYRGVPVVADLRAVPGLPWFLVSKIDTAEVYAPLRARLWQSVIFFGALILVSGAGLVAVWRQQRVRYYRAQAEAAEALRESEERYRGMYENSTIGFYRTTPDGKILLANASLVNMLGYSSFGELSARDLTKDGYEPSYPRARFLELMEKEGEVRGFESAWQRRDRNFLFVRESARAIRNPQGEVLFYDGTVEDITERKQAENALRDSQAQVTGIFNAAMDAILTVDEEQKIRIFNPSAEQMFGCPASEALGQTLDRFLPETVRKEHREYLRVFGQSNSTKRSMKTPTLAPTCLRADGEAFPSEVSISQLEIGGQKFYTAIVRDITERKRAEEKLTASEVRYRRLFEAARDGILILEAESGVVIDVNPFLVEMLGFSQEEICGKELWELGFFKDIAANKNNFLELQQKEFIQYEGLPLETADGRSIQVEFVSNVYQVNHHKVVQCNIRDITERKQTENMIAARLRLVEFSAHHSLDELLTKTLDEVCVITNSPIGFYHFVEADQKTLSLQAWSTRTLQEYCKAEGKGLHYDLEQAGVWADCIREKQPVIHNDYASLAHRRGLPAGHAELARELVVPILREGLIVAILGVGNKAQEYAEKDVDIVAYFADVAWEIARRKRTEQALADYTNHLEEMVDARTYELRETQEQLVRHERLATLGQLAGSIGHELRNPLGVISNAVYFLKAAQPDADDKVKDYLGIIDKEARISDKIITDLLDFTRIKSQDRQPVAVSELVRQTLERYPAPPSVEVTLEIPPDLPPVYADPQHILQVLGNLTVNACQSMLEGGQLSLCAFTQDDMIRIVVQDTGMGIPPENMKKLFGPLFTTKTKGIGLGLAVSWKLIEANGGKIEVESEAGKGSTFTLVLPIYK